MSSSLDMSLDDLIKNNKKSGSRAGGRGSSGPGPGPSRRLPNRAPNRAAPYVPSATTPEMMWQHDMFANQAAMMGMAAAAIETGTKLYVSNLDYGVSNEDIKELFSEVSDLKRYSIHYDRSGRSKGTAEVVFSCRADAVAAFKRYNNVQLDGKLMKIEIVGTNVATSAAPAVAVIPFANANGVPRGGQRKGGAIGRLRGGGGGRGGFGTSRGRRRGSCGEKEVELFYYSLLLLERIEQWQQWLVNYSLSEIRGIESYGYRVLNQVASTL